MRYHLNFNFCIRRSESLPKGVLLQSNQRQGQSLLKLHPNEYSSQFTVVPSPGPIRTLRLSPKARSEPSVTAPMASLEATLSRDICHKWPLLSRKAESPSSETEKVVLRNSLEGDSKVIMQEPRAAEPRERCPGQSWGSQGRVSNLMRITATPACYLCFADSNTKDIHSTLRSASHSERQSPLRVPNQLGT